MRQLRWAWRNRQAIRKDNRWLNLEDGLIKYRGAEYCISCRQPIMGGIMCQSCSAEQGVLVPEPNMGAIKQGQAKWNKAVTDMEET